MEQIISYVKPELMVVSFALYFLGKWMKNSKRIKDKDIPLSLGGIGIIICGMLRFGQHEKRFYGTVHVCSTRYHGSRTKYIR